jgi:FkbM family methyltransferase
VNRICIDCHSFDIPDGYQYVENLLAGVKQDSDERKEIVKFLDITKNCKCLMDVGSALGIFSLLFANSYRESFAIEPSHVQQPYYTQLYLFNKDKRIYPQKMMFGNENTLVKSDLGGFHGAAYVGEDKSLMMKMDDFCSMNYIRPDAIKIDVEGFEIHVLNGALQVISVCKPIIFMEGHNKFLKNYGFTPEQLAQSPAKINYQVFDLDGKKLTEKKYLSLLKMDKDFTHTYWMPKG